MKRASKNRHKFLRPFIRVAQRNSGYDPLGKLGSQVTRAQDPGWSLDAVLDGKELVPRGLNLRVRRRVASRSSDIFLFTFRNRICTFQRQILQRFGHQTNSNHLQNDDAFLICRMKLSVCRTNFYNQRKTIFFWDQMTRDRPPQLPVH